MFLKVTHLLTLWILRFHLAVNEVKLWNKFINIQMDNSFARVKSIIERLREVLKCQKCLQMKREDLMLFFHICDHFYCLDCMSDDKTCIHCKNPLDRPTIVVNDKNILSLYQSLAKFELPSKEDVKKIYRTHKDSKENKAKEILKEDEVQETPKNKEKCRFNIRERESRKHNLTSPIGTETVIVSSDSNEASIKHKKICPTDENPSTSGKEKKNSVQGRKRRSIVKVSTPVGKKRDTTPITILSERQNTTPVIKSGGSSKGNTSISRSNINKRNPKGETQLHLACKKSNFTAMAELIAAGADPNAQDNAGWTPLHDSVFSANINVIKFLLDNGAKVNTPGLESTTALHEAVAKGNVEIVKLLLEYGADVNAMNIFKESSLDLVTKYKLDEMKEVLLEASKNLNKTSEVEEFVQKFLLYNYNLSVEDEKLVNKFVEKFEGEIISTLTSKTPPSHIIVPDEKVTKTWALISSVPKGCWVVTTNWIKDSLNENSPKSASSYELSSPTFSGFSKARANKLNQWPGLFSGCHFFFGGNFEHYVIKNITIKKDDLKNLIEKNGGIIVKRCPDPESLALEKTIPYHASATSSLRETSYFIIYQKEKWDPKPKYNMSHMKTLPVEWLVCCILKFELIDPNDEVSWIDFL